MAVTTQIFKTPTLEQTVNQFADHMPVGKAWEAKYVDGSNMRGLQFGCARPFNISQSYIELLSNEFDINKTTLLINEWEESVGLPDDCLGLSGDIEQRRENVITRLNKAPIVTLQEMQDYVDNIFPSSGIILFTGVEYYSFELSFEATFIGDLNTKFVIVAEIPQQEPNFEYEFEFEFTGAVDNPELRCVLEKIIPANVVLIIEEADDR